MRSGDIVQIARQRAGLTQQQLAQRSGHPRESIARWETGAREPALSTLQQVVAACDLDLVVTIARGDSSLVEAVADQLGVSPKRRLRRLLAASDARDVLWALRWLRAARTPVVVIGDIAATLHGGGQRPRDAAVEFVAGDPVAMDSELRAAGFKPRDTESRWVDTDRRAQWDAPGHGSLVLASAIPGTSDFADLRRSAVELDLEPGVIRVAHPRDLLRIAEASSRQESRSRAPGLRALLNAQATA